LSFCWLTIIGAITPSLLQSILTQKAVGGGLMSRIIFVVGYGPIKKIALPFYSKEEEILQQDLMNDLEQIALLSGPFRMTKEFLQCYTEWYETETGAVGINDNLINGYNGRRPLHVNKLCMILSACESDKMEITANHFKTALAILEETEMEMPNAFRGLGLGSHAEVYSKVLTFIENKKNFDFNEILNAFQLDTVDTELAQYLNMAERTGKIKVENSATTTRYTLVEQTKQKIDTQYLKSTLYRRML